MAGPVKKPVPMMPGWTCLLASKDHLMLFHLPRLPSRSMRSDQPTKQDAFGVKQ